jgi:uncharacterized protein YcnI
MKKSLKPVRTVAIALGAGVVLALAPAAAASAHVSASATSTAAGSSSVVTFSVPHGCDGSPTTVVTIQLPESVPTVTPTVNPSWTVEKVVEQLAEPLTDAHGNEITERVTSVVYTTTGAGLPDGYRDTFDLSLRLPEGEVGDVVAFPVVQTCSEGTAEWVGDEAPSVTLTSAVEDDGNDEVAAEAPPAMSDPLARVFGIGGLAVGSVGVMIAVLGRRSARA